MSECNYCKKPKSRLTTARGLCNCFINPFCKFGIVGTSLVCFEFVPSYEFPNQELR